MGGLGGLTRWCGGGKEGVFGFLCRAAGFRMEEAAWLGCKGGYLRRRGWSGGEVGYVSILAFELASPPSCCTVGKVKELRRNSGRGIFIL